MEWHGFLLIYRCRGPPDSQFRLARVILAASRVATAARLLQATVPDGTVWSLRSGRLGRHMLAGHPDVFGGIKPCIMVKFFHFNWERNGQILGKHDHDKNIYISTELAIFLNHQQCLLGIIQQSLKFNTSPLKAMMFIKTFACWVGNCSGGEHCWTWRVWHVTIPNKHVTLFFP